LKSSRPVIANKIYFHNVDHLENNFSRKFMLSAYAGCSEAIVAEIFGWKNKYRPLIFQRIPASVKNSAGNPMVAGSIKIKKS